MTSHVLARQLLSEPDFHLFVEHGSILYDIKFAASVIIVQENNVVIIEDSFIDI